MDFYGPKYIGPITLASLRAFVLEHQLTAADSILLHPRDMAVVLFEYRQLYGRGMPEAFDILGVFLDEDTADVVPMKRVAALLNDDRPERPRGSSAQNDAASANYYSIIYRCGHCGGFVDQDGHKVAESTRVQLIELLNSTNFNGQVQKVHGRCCKAN